MNGVAENPQSSAARPMPRGLKWVAATTVVALLAGALLLLTARGEAILIDLYAAAAQMLCF